jgi:hypothetical protein
MTDTIMNNEIKSLMGNTLIEWIMKNVYASNVAHGLKEFDENGTFLQQMILYQQ